MFPTDWSAYQAAMKLYAVSDGPPSLAVRMTLAALNVPYELKSVNFNAGEHLTDEYAKVCSRWFSWLQWKYFKIYSSLSYDFS